MKTYTLKKITMFDKRNTKVKVEIIDGTYFAEGEGVAHCADGDDFDTCTGQVIACKRAVIKATKKLIKEHQLMINAYEKASAKLQQHIDGVKAHLVQFENDLDYLINN